MKQLNHYMQKWSLEAPKLLAETYTSQVYLVQQNQQDVVLKLLNEVGIRDEKRGAIALRYFEGNGSARLLDARDDAHLLEYLQGDDLVSMVKAGRDDDATHIIGNVVKTLHTQNNTIIPDDLHTLRRRFQSLFEYVAGNDNSTLKYGADIAEELLSTEQDPVVLHGDIHHWNIKHSERGWLAFDPKGLYGERTYDVANAILNPVTLPEIVQDEARLLRHISLYAEILNIPQERILHFTFAHACLSITWSIEDEHPYQNTFVVAQLLENLVKSRPLL